MRVNLFTVMTKPIVVVLTCVGIVLCMFYVDNPLAYDLMALDLDHRFPFLQWVTELGLGSLYLIPLPLLALYFRYGHRNHLYEVRTWFLWGCALIPSALCLVLKILLGRARPELLFNAHLYGFYGLQLKALYWSFPSGHTSTVMGFVFGLCVLFPRYSLAFMVPGLIVVSSRVFLTHHYLSDVLAASYFSLLEVALLHWWLKQRPYFSALGASHD